MSPGRMAIGTDPRTMQCISTSTTRGCLSAPCARMGEALMPDRWQELNTPSHQKQITGIMGNPDHQGLDPPLRTAVICLRVDRYNDRRLRVEISCNANPTATAHVNAGGATHLPASKTRSQEPAVPRWSMIGAAHAAWSRSAVNHLAAECRNTPHPGPSSNVVVHGQCRAKRDWRCRG